MRCFGSNSKVSELDSCYSQRCFQVEKRVLGDLRTQAKIVSSDLNVGKAIKPVQIRRQISMQNVNNVLSDKIIPQNKSSKRFIRRLFGIKIQVTHAQELQFDFC